MLVSKVYKYEIAPTRTQEQYLNKCCAASRTIYNLLLEQQYEFKHFQHKKSLTLEVAKARPNSRSTADNLTLTAPYKGWQSQELTNALKDLPDDYKWLRDVPNTILRESLHDLHRALAVCKDKKKLVWGTTWWAPDKKTGSWKLHSLKFRSWRNNSSFRVQGSASIKLSDKRIELTKIGSIKSKEKLNKNLLNAKPQYCTIKKEGNRWFATISVKVEVTPRDKSHLPTCGIDVGLKANNTAVLVDDTGRLDFDRYCLPLNDLKKLDHKISSRQAKRDRRLASVKKAELRKQGLSEDEINHLMTPRKGYDPLKDRRQSSRQKEHEDRVQRKRWKQKEIKRDWYAKFIRFLVDSFGVTGLEDLNLRGLKQGKQSKGFHTVALGELSRRLTYKSEWEGGQVVKVNPAYTSQDCPSCGERTGPKDDTVNWECSSCGAKWDRDEVGARNVLARTLRALAVASSNGASSAKKSTAGQAETNRRNPMNGRGVGASTACPVGAQQASTLSRQSRRGKAALADGVKSVAKSTTYERAVANAAMPRRE